MAAKPKLTPEQWKQARAVWQKDKRIGFPWLIEELGLPVSAEAVRLKSKKEGWKKRGKPSLDIKKTKLVAGGKKRKTNNEKKKAISDVKVSESNSDDFIEDSHRELEVHGNSKYSRDFNRQAQQLCLLGATDLEIAEFFGVAESTIYKWKLDHPTFSEAIKKGKIIADAKMAERLYVKGCGYRYSEIKQRFDVGEDGKETPVEVTKTEKEVPPDGPSALRWLYNRRPQNWRDKVEASVEFKLDKEELDRIKETFIERMRISRERQNQVLIDRGLLIEHDEEQEKD